MGPIYIDGKGDNIGKKTNLRALRYCEGDPNLIDHSSHSQIPFPFLNYLLSVCTCYVSYIQLF